MSSVRRLVPHPWLSVVLATIWIVASESLAGGTLLMAGVLALGIPQLTHRFWPDTPQAVRVVPLLRLLPVVLGDIVVANLRVARLVIGPASRLRPRFLVVPLDVRHPYAITALSSIITLTPGTVSVNVSGDRASLLVHALDVQDPDAEVRRIKARYERPLLEVFPC